MLKRIQREETNEGRITTGNECLNKDIKWVEEEE